MKYIRTTDERILEATDWDEDGSCWCLNDSGAYFRKEDIIAQADTIEELCDEFVVVNLKYNIHRFYDKTKSDWTLQTYACSPTHIVYGCIWTDKGLIYVAKMNEDGVLCLI